MLWWTCPPGSSGQDFAELTPGIAASPPALRADGPAIGEFNVVAIRVEFQPDTSRFTTGTGTFGDDPYEGLVPAVDPLPHDQAFFQAHLDALAHYIRRVSDGRATLNTILLPETIRVSSEMSAYTPVGLEASSDAELTKLAALVSEAWTLGNQQLTVDLTPLDPERTVFFLFHAGIGRDIELVGTTLEKTPLDLPSIYFDGPALQRLGAGEMRIGGIDVSNTAVIPRSETRRGFDFVTETFFLAELTTNGLLVASFLNFLGAPDLFDTSSGESAIGPFGLMDPLGIFAYNGLLPPEPMAWTKMFLGWTEAVDIRPGNSGDLSIRHASADGSSEVIRVWVSSTEYFLVENRNRDAQEDGLVLTVWDAGELREQRVDNGDPSFNSQTIEGFSGGVVVAADDYDWSLPGGLDEHGNPLVGGALIWHVDERLIRERLADNSVNANPDLRGVDLEEADSGQDLGPSLGNFLGPQLHLGSPFDFFFLNNPVTAITPSGRSVTLYENRFGPDTFPDSRTNGGGPSFVSIGGFSEPGPTMNVSIEWLGEEGTGLVDGWPVDLSAELSETVRIEGERGSLVACEDQPPFVAVPIQVGETRLPGIAVIRDDGSVSVFLPDGLQESLAACRSGRLVMTAMSGGSYSLVEMDPVNGETRDWSLPVSASSFSAPDRIIIENGSAILVFESMESILIVTVSPSGSVTVSEIDGEMNVWGYSGEGLVALGGVSDIKLYRTSGAPVEDVDPHIWSLMGLAGELSGEPAFGRDDGGLFGAAVSTDGVLVLLGSDGLVRTVNPDDDLGLGPLRSSSPVIADLDRDGHHDVLVVAGSDPAGFRLAGFSQGGAMLSGFPIRLPAPVIGQPLVIRDAESSAATIVVAATDGYLYAYDISDRSRLVPGFPLAVGGRVEITPSVMAVPETPQDPLRIRVFAASTAGAVSSWALSRYDAADWPNRYGPDNKAFVQIGPAEPDGGTRALLVRGETYNWPNPVTEGRTNFRFLVTEDCSVSISIVDPAGAVIDEVRVQDVQGDVPSEVSWTTSASSGFYFARIRARTTAGRQDDVLVKLAIIR